MDTGGELSSAWIGWTSTYVDALLHCTHAINGLHVANFLMCVCMVSARTQENLQLRSCRTSASSISSPHLKETYSKRSGQSETSHHEALHNVLALAPGRVAPQVAQRCGGCPTLKPGLGSKLSGACTSNAVTGRVYSAGVG